MAIPTDPALRRSPVDGGQEAHGEDRPQAPNEKTQIERFFGLSNDLLATFSPDGRLILLNSAWEEVLGWTLIELQDRLIQDFIHPDDLEQTMALMLAGRHRSAHFTNFTNRYRHRDGSWRWLLWGGRCEQGIWYASAKDITDRMWLERQALHDPLTKLPNRLLLMDRAHQAVARLRRSHGLVAILFIDLDGFKQVNDSFGHAVGDHLLISVSERLAEMLRDSDTVARLGGDEFVILAEDLKDGEAWLVAERVLHALEEPFPGRLRRGVDVCERRRVGGPTTPKADPEDLLREADVAMYRAKGTGGHQPGTLRREPAQRGRRSYRTGQAPASTRCRAPRAIGRVSADVADRRRQRVACRGARRWLPRWGALRAPSQPQPPSCRWPRRAT